MHREREKTTFVENGLYIYIIPVYISLFFKKEEKNRFDGFDYFLKEEH